MNGVVGERLRNHLLVSAARSLPEAAAHMFATQSQELWAGKFALAMRTQNTPSAREVDAAFDRGELIRTWPFRGTLHIMHPADVELALTLSRDRTFAKAAGRHRQLGLEADDFTKAERIARSALPKGALSRADFTAALNAGGVDTSGQRGAHLILGLAVRGVMHWGATVPHATGHATAQLLTLNDALPAQNPITDDPQAELARRYLRGHAPATAEDFAWWSGLTLTQARAAFAGLESSVPEPSEPPTGLIALGAFDEYYLSYGDRTTVCAPEHAARVGPGINGAVLPIILSDGIVVGTWHRSGEVTLFDGSLQHEGVLATYREHAL